MDLKLIITDALQFFRNHLFQIAALCLPWLLAISVVEYLITSAVDPSVASAEEGNPLPFLSLGFQLLVYPVYTAALILLMESRAQGETRSIQELLSAAIQIWQPMFILHLIMVGVLYPIMIITFQGGFLFIIPFIFLLVRLCFAEFYLVLEDVRPLDAIKMSFSATKPYFFQILVLLILFAIPFMIMNAAITLYSNNSQTDPLTYILPSAAVSFLSLIADISLFRAYMSVKKGPQE